MKHAWIILHGSMVAACIWWMIDNAAYYRGMAEGDRRARAAADLQPYVDATISDLINPLRKQIATLEQGDPAIRQLQSAVNELERRDAETPFQVYSPPSAHTVHPSSPRSDGTNIQFMARYNERTNQSQKWNGNKWIEYGDDEVPPPPPPFDESGKDGWQTWVVSQPLTVPKHVWPGPPE